jgi:hypothetical protein
MKYNSPLSANSKISPIQDIVKAANNIFGAKFYENELLGRKGNRNGFKTKQFHLSLKELVEDKLNRNR